MHYCRKHSYNLMAYGYINYMIIILQQNFNLYRSYEQQNFVHHSKQQALL